MSLELVNPVNYVSLSRTSAYVSPCHLRVFEKFEEQSRPCLYFRISEKIFNPVNRRIFRMSEEKFNPAIWDELRTPETGSRPRYPNEVGTPPRLIGALKN